MKLTLRKTTLIIVLCIFIAGALLHGCNTDSVPQKDPSEPEQLWRRIQSRTEEPEEPEEIQYSPAEQLVSVSTTFRELDDIIEKYAEEHWDFDHLVLAYTDELVCSFLDIVNIAADNLKNKTEPMDLFCVPMAYASQFTKGIIPICLYIRRVEDRCRRTS